MFNIFDKTHRDREMGTFAMWHVNRISTEYQAPSWNWYTDISIADWESDDCTCLKNFQFYEVHWLLEMIVLVLTDTAINSESAATGYITFTMLDLANYLAASFAPHDVT